MLYNPCIMRTWLEISKKNIQHNYKTFRGLINSDCLLACVVKSNAYGHNLMDFSLIMEDLGIDWIIVDSIIEAKSLKNVGIKKPILVLGHTLQDDINYAVLNNISLTIADFPTLENLRNYSHKKIKVHIKIDTGMHRQGFFPYEIPKVIEILKKEKNNIIVEGVYTHFATAKDPFSTHETLEQIKEFKKSINLLNHSGFTKFIKHASATSGAIIFKEAHFDMIRVGIGMYGIWPSEEIKTAFQNKISLKPVLSWKTIVTQIKTIPKGSKLGYDFTEEVTRKSKIAILPIGYWHGFSRKLSSIGKVIIKGKKVKVLGRVCMDMIIVDITDIKEVNVGDEATIIGKEKRTEITATDISSLLETSPYETITCLNPRIKRIVI